MSGRAPAAAIDAFYAVRDMLYALDSAHDADSLEQLGAGDCLAKAELLARHLHNAGLDTRLVRWRYLLPEVVPEVADLPSRLDLHRAVRVRIAGVWVLVDATHDPGLAGGGLTVSDWDGRHSTPPAYPAVGNVMTEGDDDTRIRTALAEVEAWTAACDERVLQRWRKSYMVWLAEVRRSTVHRTSP